LPGNLLVKDGMADPNSGPKFFLTLIRWPFPPKAKEIMLRPHEEHAVGDRRRRHARVAQRVRRQHLELRPRPDHLHAALLAGEVYLAVGRRRRGGEAALDPEALLVNLLARLRLVTGDHPGVRAGVEILAVDDRRRHVRPALADAPGHCVVAGL